MSKRDPDDSDIPRIGLAKGTDDDEVTHIPRGRSRLKIPVRHLFVIGMTLITLIVILTMRKSCADSVGKAFNNFAPPPIDAGPPPSKGTDYILVPGPPIPVPTTAPTPAPSSGAPQPTPAVPAPAPSQRPAPPAPGK